MLFFNWFTFSVELAFLHKENVSSSISGCRWASVEFWFIGGDFRLCGWLFSLDLHWWAYVCPSDFNKSGIWCG